MIRALSVTMVSLLVAFSFSLQGCATTRPTRSQIEAQRGEIREMAHQTVAHIRKEYPEARSMLDKAAGYAVFSDFGYKLLFMGSAMGKGVAIKNDTKRATFMKMFEMQPGLGLGAHKFRVLFVFETHKAFDQFVTSGWEFGGGAEAAIKTGTQGGGGMLGATVSPGVLMYQLSEKGAIVGISITGAKYYKDDELN